MPELEYAARKKRTRRKRFRDPIEAATPWALLVVQIEPPCHKGKRGGPPSGIERMLRMYIVQRRFGLVDKTPENAVSDSDLFQAAQLLHGAEDRAHADAADMSLATREEMRGQGLTFDIAKKRSEVRKLPAGPERNAARAEERSKAQVRAMGERPFHVVKNLYRRRKVRYRGLAKNDVQRFGLFALANLARASGRLPALPPHGILAS